MGSSMRLVESFDPRTAGTRYLAFLVTAIVVSTAINFVFDHQTNGHWPKWGTLIGGSIGWLTSFLWRVKART